MEKVLAALSQAADGAWAVDQAQRIVFWNAAAENMLEYGAEEVRWRHCFDVFHGRPHPGCLECHAPCVVMLAARRGIATAPYNLLSQTKSGAVILLNVSVIVPPFADCSLALIHLFRDITRQLHYETYVDRLLRAATRLPLPLITSGRYPPRRHHFPTPLTGREKEVLYLLMQGRAPRDIATTLSLSYATVRNHLQNTLRKLGAHNQRELVKLAHEQRLV